MAVFQADDIFKDMMKEEDVERVLPKMLREASLILQKTIRDNAPVVNGDLKQSILATMPYKKHGDYMVNIRPTRKDRNGVSNAKKMSYLEYGTYKQSPTPLLNRSCSSAESSVEAKLQEVFDREVNI